MGKLLSIGYNGQPVREPFRIVRPPIPVLVDLTVLFPREPHRSGRYHPHGLQMHKVVEGRLTCWGICEQGDWWGLVTYEIAYGSKRKPVTHWVPAWTLRRNDAGEAPGRRKRAGRARGGVGPSDQLDDDAGERARRGAGQRATSPLRSGANPTRRNDAGEGRASGPACAASRGP